MLICTGRYEEVAAIHVVVFLVGSIPLDCLRGFVNPRKSRCSIDRSDGANPPERAQRALSDKTTQEGRGKREINEQTDDVV